LFPAFSSLRRLPLPHLNSFVFAHPRRIGDQLSRTLIEPAAREARNRAARCQAHIKLKGDADFMKPILVALFLVAGLSTAYAQETPKRHSAEEMKDMMQSSMSAMGPMMNKAAEAAIELQLGIAEKPETAKRIAQFKKNLYDALVQQGFTKDQALSIVLSTPLPGAGPGGR